MELQRKGDPIHACRLLIQDDTSGAVIGVDVCEDLWVPVPPSSLHALSGANAIVRISPHPMRPSGKERYRRDRRGPRAGGRAAVSATSSAAQARTKTPATWSTQRDIGSSRNAGGVISEAVEHFDDETRGVLYGEIDLERCEQDRIRLNTAMRSRPA